MNTEIEEILRKSKEARMRNIPKAKIAERISRLGYLLMIPGTVIWIFTIFFSYNMITLPTLTLIVIIGSLLAGTSSILIPIGSYIYLTSSSVANNTHYTIRSYSRTIFQIYTWLTFIAIFFTARRISPTSTLDFIIVFTLLSLPTILGYPLGHWSRVRNTCMNLLSKKGKEPTS